MTPKRTTERATASATRSASATAPGTGDGPRPRPGFLSDFETCSAALRAALTDLVLSTGADPTAPQDLSRRFGINRTMAWKVSRIIASSDACEVAQHLLGDSGVRILVGAFEREGAPSSVAAGVLEATERFDRMVAEHAGSRASLELMLTSMVPERVDHARVEASHELAFRGNSAIFGVQAQLRIGAQIVAPNADDPGRVDIGVLSCLARFRCLRPSTGWQLCSHRTWGDGIRSRIEPMDPGVGPDDAPLMRAFCSDELPPIHMRAEGHTRYHELGESQVGETAAFDAVFGWIDRSFAPIHGGPDDVAEHSIAQDTPTERVHLDLLLHETLPITVAPAFKLVSLAQGRPTPPHSTAVNTHLPCRAAVQPLGTPPALSTPGFSRYPDVVAHACERMGHEVGAFRAYRVSLRFPPIPSQLVLHYPLAAR